MKTKDNIRTERHAYLIKVHLYLFPNTTTEHKYLLYKVSVRSER